MTNPVFKCERLEGNSKGAEDWLYIVGSGPAPINVCYGQINHTIKNHEKSVQVSTPIYGVSLEHPANAYLRRIDLGDEKSSAPPHSQNGSTPRTATRGHRSSTPPRNPPVG